MWADGQEDGTSKIQIRSEPIQLSEPMPRPVARERVGSWSEREGRDFLEEKIPTNSLEKSDGLAAAGHESRAGNKPRAFYKHVQYLPSKYLCREIHPSGSSRERSFLIWTFVA